MIDRRNFLKTSSAALTYGLISSYAPILNATENNVLAEVKNGEIGKMVQKAVELVGGMSKFVRKGDIVVVKPNIGWARRPEQAANTNPEVVAEVIRLCSLAGARKVKIFDNTCNEAKRCYLMSGIENAAKSSGAEVRHIFRQKFKKVDIPEGKALQSWEFYADVLETDVFINVPVIKHHSLAKVTMGIKNMMGIIGGNRGEIHNNFAQKIVDINTVVRPQLTILDGTKVLLRNGPQGGNVSDVKDMNTIIAGTDIVSVDALGAQLFGLPATELDYLKVAHSSGLGEIDLNKVQIKRVDMS